MPRAQDLRVSKASRSASPMKVSSSSVSTSTTNVGTEIHHASRLSLPWRSSSPSDGSAGHAEAEEVERGEEQDRGAHPERQERDHRRHRIGQHVAADDLPVRQAHRARRLHELEIAVAQEFGAHVVGQADPAEQREHAQQQQQRRLRRSTR